MIDVFLKNSASFFYTDILMLVCMLVSLAISFTKPAGRKYTKILRIYLILGLLEVIFGYVSLYNKSGYITVVETLLYSVFVFFEFFTIYFIVYKNLSSPGLKKIIKASALLFGVVFILYMTVDILNVKYGYFQGIDKYLLSPYVIVNLFLMIPGIVYYYELFRYAPKEMDLKQSGLFWIVTGFFFYACSTIPPVLMEFYIQTKGYSLPFSLYTFNYIFYAILYSMIAKSFLCKRVA